MIWHASGFGIGFELMEDLNRSGFIPTCTTFRKSWLPRLHLRKVVHCTCYWIYFPQKISCTFSKKQRRLGYGVGRQDFVSYVCFLATCFLLDSGHDAGVCAHARMHIQGLWMPQPNREHGDHIAVPRCGSMRALQRTQ